MMTYDPDNPPLRPGIVWQPAREYFLERAAEFHAKRQLLLAHHDSFNNRARLESYEGSCGCFYCLKTYPASSVTKWVGKEESTALCPYCHIDAVIPRADEAFLRAMHDRWFGRRSKVVLR